MKDCQFWHFTSKLFRLLTAVTGVACRFEPALATCETSQVLLAGVSGVFFFRGTPVSPHLPVGLSRYEWNNLERAVKLNEKKKLLTGDRRQTKQFCFLDADCLVVGESQSSSRRSTGRYPVKSPRPEGDSQTIDTLQCRNS